MKSGCIPWDRELLQALARTDPQWAVNCFERAPYFEESWPHAEDLRVPWLTRKYLKKSIEEGKISWGRLPLEFQNDIRLARICDCFEDLDYFDSVIEKFPDLGVDVAFLEKHLRVDHYDHDVYWEEFFRLLPPLVDGARAEVILSDHNLMLKFCQRTYVAFGCIGASLNSDRGFVAALLETNPENVFNVQHLLPHTQLRFSDLIMSALPGYAKWCENDGFVHTLRELDPRCLRILLLFSNGSKLVLVFPSARKSSREAGQTTQRRRKLFF